MFVYLTKSPAVDVVSFGVHCYHYKPSYFHPFRKPCPLCQQGFPSGSVVKNLSAIQETQEAQVQSLGQEDPLEEEMVTQTHSSILDWESPRTEKPGRLPSMEVPKSQTQVRTHREHSLY